MTQEVLYVFLLTNPRFNVRCSPCPRFSPCVVLSFSDDLLLRNVTVTLMMGTKITTALDSSRASGPDCIPVVVQMNCESQLLGIIADLFNS